MHYACTFCLCARLHERVGNGRQHQNSSGARINRASSRLRYVCMYVCCHACAHRHHDHALIGRTAPAVGQKREWSTKHRDLREDAKCKRERQKMMQRENRDYQGWETMLDLGSRREAEDGVYSYSAWTHGWGSTHGWVAVNDPLPIALFSVQLLKHLLYIDFISKWKGGWLATPSTHSSPWSAPDAMQRETWGGAETYKNERWI